MKLGSIKGEEVFFSDIYDEQLKIIDGIKFTRREIDIISFFVNGRSTKKIAIFFSISPKTVENHTRNIMIKLECNSREQIIDFIEKSNKFSFLGEYYKKLLIDKFFEKILCDISRMLSQIKLSCQVFVHSSGKTSDLFAEKIKYYLKHAGIDISHIKKKENYKLYDKCCFLHLLFQKDFSKVEEIFKDFSSKNENIKNIFYISSKKIINEDNYYYLILEIINTFIANPEIESKIIEFKEYYNRFSYNFLNDEKKQIKNKKFNIKNKIKLVYFILFFVLLLAYCFYKFFYKNPDSFEKVQSVGILNYEKKTFCEVFKPCKFFSGRQKYISKINNILKENNKVVVVGYQGVGKTQLAYKYAEQNINHYEGGMYLFNGSSTEKLINSIRLFSVIMGIIEKDEAYKLSDDQIRKIIVPILKDRLKSSKPILFIFDAADSYNQIKDFIPTQSPQHHLLITSCSKKWDAWDFLELKGFDRTTKEAEYLVLKTLKNETPDSARKLVDKLGHYPLAIAQATNYLKNNNIMTIEKYLKEYDSLYERRKFFLKYHPFQQDNYIKTTVTAFEIFQKVLIKEKKKAYDLLKICSYFDDVVPQALFGDESEILELLDILNKYSIIDVSNVNGEFFINIHNVIKDIIKIQINEKNEEDYLKIRIVDLIDQYFNFNLWNKIEIENVRLIVHHTLHFIKYLHKGNDPFLENPKLISLLAKVGSYYIHCLRDSKKAVDILEKAKKKFFLAKRRDTLIDKIVNDLSTSYYYNGDYNKARNEIDLLQKTSSLSADTLILKGHILYNECKYNESQAVYEKALKIAENQKILLTKAIANRSLGLVHYRKSKIYKNENKNIMLSKKYIEKAISLHTKTNKKDLEFAITMHALARVLVELKELSRAKNLFSNAIRIASDYCKNEKYNYEILIMKRSYGNYICNYEKKQFRKGVKLLKESLLGKMKIYKNKQHQAVIGTMEVIAKIYSLNKYDEDLENLISIIKKYLKKWDYYKKIDHSKNINKKIISKKIEFIKNVLSESEELNKDL